MVTIATRTAIDHLRRLLRNRERIDARPPEDLESRLPPEEIAPFEPDPARQCLFHASNFFRREEPACAALLKEFCGPQAGWTGLARREGANANTIAQRWSRCLKKFRAAVRTRSEYGFLRELLDG